MKLCFKINVKWIETTGIEEGKLKVEEAMKGVNGLIVPGGFGASGVEGNPNGLGRNAGPVNFLHADDLWNIIKK